jgi:hypothetical protein
VIAYSANNWRRLQSEWVFSGHELMSVWSFLVLAAMLAALITGIWAWRHARAGVEAGAGGLRSKPMLIFHQIARETGVGPKDEWLLIKVARQQVLPTPLALLLSPGTFDHHVRRYLLTVSPKRLPQVSERLGQLGRFLFSEDANAEASPVMDTGYTEHTGDPEDPVDAGDAGNTRAQWGSTP